MPAVCGGCAPWCSGGQHAAAACPHRQPPRCPVPYLDPPRRRDRLPALLDRLRLGHGGVKVEGTPRRLTAVVHQLAARQSNSADTVRGPPVKAAYDAAGAPTNALLGFCKKNGVTGECSRRVPFR